MPKIKNALFMVKLLKIHNTDFLTGASFQKIGFFCYYLKVTGFKPVNLSHTIIRICLKLSVSAQKSEQSGCIYLQKW